MWSFILGLVLVSGGVLSSPVHVKKPFPRDIQHNLDTNILPLDYKLTIDVPEEALEDGTTESGFTGIVIITFNVTGPLTNASSFPIHSDNQEITSITLQDDNGQIIRNNGILPTGRTNELLQLSFDGDLIKGQYKLTIVYTGYLSPTSMAGFYKSSYQDSAGKNRVIATTQFESTDARKAFPCFDVPYLKATFQVTITCPKDKFAISNTPEEKRDGQEFTFQMTPPISTYLVAFIVSDFSEVTGPDTTDLLQTNLYTRDGTQELANLAIKVAPIVLDQMASFTGYNYSESGIGKMSQVAIPDFAAGAMENWGLVTYRDVDILVHDEFSPHLSQQQVATVIAHEFAHQWFGDLVTLSWWDDTFLNEGFATYFEFHTLDAIDAYKEWELPRQMVVEELQTALSSDSSANSKALHSNVESNDEISGRFDNVSYNKGGSILRMIHHFLTQEIFLQNLRYYIGVNKEHNANYLTLWQSFDKEENPAHEQTVSHLPEGVTMEKVMDAWTTQPGYPLLTVKLTGKNVTVSQERFLTTPIANGINPNTTWYVPITCTLDKDPVETDTNYWLTPDADFTFTFPENSNSTWLVLNNQQTAYYRVDYDDKLWETISKSISSSNVDTLNRAQIVDDLLTFAINDKKPLSRVLDLLTNILVNETDYYPWYSAFAGFNTILKRTGQSRNRQYLSDYVAKLAKNVVESTSFEPQTNHISMLKQALVNSWSCKLGNDDCISQSQELLTKFLDTTPSVPVPANLRSTVYCNALRHNNNKTVLVRQWNALLDEFEKTIIPSEKSIITTALGCTDNEDLLKYYLSIALEKQPVLKIRQQDVRQVVTAVLTGSPGGVDVALDYLIANLTSINTYFGSTSTFTTLFGSVTDYLSTQQQIDKANDFVKTLNATVANLPSLQRYIENANSNLEITNALGKQISSYFEPSGASSFSVSFSLVIFASFCLLFKNL